MSKKYRGIGASGDHPQARITGPVVVHGAKPGDFVMIESWPLTGVPESPPAVKPLQCRVLRKVSVAATPRVVRPAWRAPHYSIMRPVSAVMACCVTFSCQNARSDPSTRWCSRGPHLTLDEALKEAALAVDGRAIHI